MVIKKTASKPIVPPTKQRITDSTKNSINIKYNMFLLYIDPGSGSLLFQALISAFLTVAVFYKKIIFYVKAKFGNFKNQDISKEEEED